MATVDNALSTQIENLQARSGKTLDELYRILRDSGVDKHGQMRNLLKSELGMGHGDANTVATLFRQQGSGDADTDPLDTWYTGAKANLRPIHLAVMKAVQQLGPFEAAPKKAYMSLRRKKQFAMVGPATRSQVEIGLNAQQLEGSERLKEQKPGGMCQYKVRLSDPSEVDPELIDWLRVAYDAAG